MAQLTTRAGRPRANQLGLLLALLFVALVIFFTWLLLAMPRRAQLTSHGNANPIHPVSTSPHDPVGGSGVPGFPHEPAPTTPPVAPSR